MVKRLVGTSKVPGGGTVKTYYITKAKPKKKKDACKKKGKK